MKCKGGSGVTNGLLRLSWLPIPLFLIAILVLWGLDLTASFESLALALAMNLVFSLLTALFIALMVARTFLTRGSPGLLFLGAGVVIWGVAGIAGSAAGLAGAPPMAIHNLCVLLSAACHLAGAILLARRVPPVNAQGLMLWLAFPAALGVVGAIMGAGLAGWLPPFFIPGQGPTPLRQVVLFASIVMFSVTAVLLRMADRPNRSPFTRWYAMALMLIAVGLFGVMLQPTNGSPLGWVGRGAQFLGGLYMLVAGLASIRETHVWEVPLENALRESEERFQSLFDYSQDAVFLTRPDTGQICRANPTACEMFGMTERELCGIGRGIIAPEEHRLAPALEERKRTGRARLDLTCVRKNGQRFPAEVTSVIVPGDPPRSFVIVRDITTRKDSEEALRKSEAQSCKRLGEIQSIYDTVHVGLCVLDRDLRYIRINRRLAELNGAPAADHIGKTVGEMVPALAATAAEIAERIFRTGEGVLDVEFSGTTPSRPGVQRTWIEQWLPLKDPGGRIIGINVMVEEITERKRMMDALRESRNQFSVLTQNLSVGVALIDRTGQFVIVNPAFLRLFDLPSESDIRNVNDRDWSQWKVFDEHGRLLDVDEHPVRKAALTGKVVRDQLVAVQSPGSAARSWILVSAEPILDAEGRIDAIICTYHDITGRRHAEEALTKAVEDLRRSNRDLEAFAHIAGHDLQEPLRMVSSFLTLLQEKYADRLDEQALDYIRFSVSGATRMSELINDLLDYSRIDVGSQRLAPVSLGAVLNDVLHTLSVGIERAGAVITADPLPDVMADEGQMRQLFQNLVGNAIKFHAPGRKPEVHIGARREADGWVMEIRDNGIGIPPDHQARIFDLFHRLHTPDDYPGTGIGLAICLRIVERHGGRIWVESEPGKGSIFRFTIQSKVSP